ncbi:hypothetical protein KVR01_012029 [Diaporthe batatas]|uniref:uncharacterized protein n=1 Tax=Diaporthe batatas TaxID=748121 RepID=UPI001D0438D3|nr:uncharacterized protein KVR01_012029 [Diaporthe batatas]KAG8158268.1 hypothetical protein KVR01_012029 [Diaporthe batatas]
MDPPTASAGGSSSTPSKVNHNQPNGSRRADKDKPCRLFRDKGRCHFGKSCKFSHDRSQDTSSPAKAPPEIDPAVRRSEDKLRSWLRLLNANHAPRRRPSDIERFFELALELMDGDLGASQETIRKLSTDLGLEFIKDVAERSIPDAVDFPTKIDLWQSQVRRLFDLITHSRLVDSNVLEQEVAMIHGFILGVNATRAAKLFDFVVDIAKAFRERDEDEKLMAVLEPSLAVLFRLVDCNTMNIVNDTFHRLVDQFDGLIAKSSQPVDSMSKLQVSKYLDYLHRRLGVGKDMAEAKDKKPAVVRAEEFVLMQDLPGQLSRDGPRHDNDHAEISKIKIMPTYQEITATRNEYLPTTDPSQWHLQGIRGRVDREFRLLREDTVGQLRDAVGEMLARLRNPGRQEHRMSQNSARTTTYDDATVHGLRLDKDRGLEVTIRCRQPDVARKMNNMQRQLWWEESKKLQPGALACVLDVAGMILFLVVADSTLRTSKDAPKNGRTGPVTAEADAQSTAKLTLSSDKDHLYVNVHLVGRSNGDVTRVLAWFREIGNAPNKRLVEFPGVLLPSFQYTLEALQQLSRKPDIPFTDLIAPETSIPAESVTVPPPLFARAPAFTFDLKCITVDHKEFSIDINNLPPVEKVTSRTGLDATQSEALLNTVSREVSLIQGPPGTGKSFTGEKVLKVILSNKQKAKLGPVICVCYTNHALDQLLEHLLDDGIKGIIRMGSRSKSERLEKLNIRVVQDEMPLTKAEKQQKFSYVNLMRLLENEAAGLLCDLSRCGSLLSVRTFLSSSYPAHFKELFPDQEDGWTKVEPKKHDVIRKWLLGGSDVRVNGRIPSRPIGDLKRTSLAGMGQQERTRLHRAWVQEIRDPIITQLVETLREHDEARETRNRVRQEVRLRCLQQANIVGVTTTGLARELHLLRKLRTKVMLCEEAGEVLEAHILTAMLPSVEQAILIGDHEQLRPQIQNYQLQSTNPNGRQYSLDMSLFERLVQPPLPTDLRLPVSLLDTQRRMHPSIAEMIRSTIYKTLKDAGNVSQYPEVEGMRRRLFWLHHEVLEAGAKEQDPHNTSHSNDHEVEMTACLVSHMVRQGKYSPEDIAVLTPYLGQLQKLRWRLAREPTFAVSLDDRDLNQLEDLELAKPERPSQPPHQTVSKTTLAKSIRLATVDNFQGEEAKVVIISLVRSNPQNRCGFLSTSNRINVLLSRAKHGCYIIGNSNTYRNVPMWNQIIQLLQANNNIGDQLELQCPRHLDTPILVSQPDDFAMLSPEAGCTLPCDRRLECGHACYGRCHSDLVHKAVKCIAECPRTKKGCNHACPLQCVCLALPSWRVQHAMRRTLRLGPLLEALHAGVELWPPVSDVLSTVVDLLEMKEYREIALDETPCIFPDCGHFLTLESMDGQMSMREHYELDENDIPVGILAATKPFSMDEVKVCSTCRGSLRSISRYGRIVRRAMLDEATKKFISWSASRHFELVEVLMKQEQKLEETLDQVKDVGRAGQLALTGDIVDQIINLRNWVGQKRYSGLMQTYLSISKFVAQVSVEEQPFHRVFEFVSHARRHKTTGGALLYDPDIIQLRGYLLALSLQLKCSIAILSDFSSLCKAAKSRQTKVIVDFAANFGLCDKLIQGAVETSRPQLEAEGHIYSTQFCVFALSLSAADEASVPDHAAEGEKAAAGDTKQPKETHYEYHKNKGLDHLSRARGLLGSANAETRKVMEAEIAAAETVLNGGVFYRPITTDEMRAVYNAMAAEFSGTGHWYTCERGHPFTVGECGMPMQQARCPECGSPVGGQNHAPAEGVRRADGIEEIARGMGGLGI